MPDYLERLLFDDIPFLEKAQAEHDAFAELLRSKDIEVVYLEDLAAEALINEEVRRQFIDQFLERSQYSRRISKRKKLES